MEQETAKKEVSNPLKDALDMRMKRVEIIGKIEQIKSTKIIDELSIQRMKLENRTMEKQGNSPIDQLMEVAKAWCIDNSKTIVGSEPAIVSLWDEDELAEIKHMIMQKVRKL